MVEDKISLALQKIGKLKASVKDVKKDIKTEEKIVDQQYLDLKKAYKELREQIKDFEEDFLHDTRESEYYNTLRELREKKEEDLAHAYEDLFEQIDKLPQKSFQMRVETEAGQINVNIQPEMKVYLNGKEEKKKSII